MTAPPVRRIELLPLGRVAALAFLPWLAARLGQRYGIPAHSAAPLPVSTAWRTAGGELSSSAVVDALIQRSGGADAPLPDAWIVALTAEPLVAPGLGSVFGEAALEGRWAVVGIDRLARGASPPLLRARTLKEVVHELGHLQGLDHCPRPECVMHPTVEVDEIDRKSSRLCPACLHHLHATPGVDPLPADG